MKTAYIHVGAPKAGSTAIQIFCRDQEQALRAQGLYFPKGGRNPKGAHHRVVNALRIRNFKNADKILAAFNRDLDRHADETLLISTEVIYNILANRTKSLKAKMADLGRFMDLITGRGYRPILIFVLRDAPAAINSGYTQAVKSFFHADGIDAWVEERVARFVPVLTLWADYARKHGFEMRVIPYNAALRQRGVIPAFLEAIDLDPALAPDLRANTGTATATVFAAQTLMQEVGLAQHRAVPTPHLKAMRECLLGVADRVIPTPDPFWGLVPSEVARIRDTCRADQTAFAQAVWGTDWDVQFQDDGDPPRATRHFADLGDLQRDQHDRIVAECLPQIRDILANGPGRD